VVVSPDELNRNIATVIVAPMNTATRSEGKNGEIVLDQIRSVDRTRLLRRLGWLPSATSRRVCDVLGEMFAWG
jgi:mRNA interferase MazF